MIKNKKQDIIYFSYHSFQEFPNIINIVSTRVGGISENPFKSLNLSFYVGDRTSNVINNREKLCNLLKIDLKSLVTCKQVHGTNIEIVDRRQKGRGVKNADDAIENTDGLITNVPNLFLFMTSADCAIVSFYEPNKKIIGIAHSGWKGTADKINKKMVEKMKREFNCNPESIIVGISPSIGPCCYKFDRKRIIKFKQYDKEKIFIKKPNETIHFNIWETIKIQLIESGILENNIELSGLCTACNKKYFYSHFSENGNTGRFCGIIGMK